MNPIQDLTESLDACMEYAGHKPACAVFDGPGPNCDCTCGWDALEPGMRALVAKYGEGEHAPLNWAGVDESMFAVAAFRYALGRMSSAPDSIANVITMIAPEMRESDRALIAKEIDERLDKCHQRFFDLPELSQPEVWRELRDKLRGMG